MIILPIVYDHQNIWIIWTFYLGIVNDTIVIIQLMTLDEVNTTIYQPRDMIITEAASIVLLYE